MWQLSWHRGKHTHTLFLSNNINDCDWHLCTADYYAVFSYNSKKQAISKHNNANFWANPKRLSGKRALIDDDICSRAHRVKKLIELIYARRWIPFFIFVIHVVWWRAQPIGDFRKRKSADFTFSLQKKADHMFGFQRANFKLVIFPFE